MLLALNVGNSNLVLGFWDGQRWLHFTRVPSLEALPGNLPWDQVKSVMMSSVVPSQTEKVKSFIATKTGKPVTVLTSALYPKLPLQILSPTEIGTDLVANAMGAFTMCKQTCIVVDFGTALTFTTISAKGKILGVSIVPGLTSALKTLTQNSSALFEVPLELPYSALGFNTPTAIQTGILLGYEGLVKNIVNKIRTELKEDALTIATGGGAHILTSLHDLFSLSTPTLALDGLRVIAHLAGV